MNGKSQPKCRWGIVCTYSRAAVKLFPSMKVASTQWFKDVLWPHEVFWKSEGGLAICNSKSCEIPHFCLISVIILGSIFIKRWRGSGFLTRPPPSPQHLIGWNWRQLGGMSGCPEFIGYMIMPICRSLLHWNDFKPFLLNSLHKDWLNE